jgi:hypothetical protein
MKKYALVLIASIAINSTSYADINVGWIAAAGFYTNPGQTDPLLDPSGNVLAQLIFTPSGTYSDANVNFPDLINPLSDSEILDTFNLTHPAGTASSEWGDFSLSAEIYAGIGPGSVYARIFEEDVPTVGSHYYYSPMQAVSVYDPMNPTFQTLQVNRDNVAGDGLYDGAPFALEVVPEPSVFALLGIGGLMLALRRRFRK